MSPVERILKTMLVQLATSPWQTLAAVGRRFVPSADNSHQVQQLREITRKTPLILQIETTNVCNSACVFCAYTKMKRPKGVMDLKLFERIVAEYAAMGGGPVSFTPLVGDALLDPHLLERLTILEGCPQVSQVSLTTNGIALERYSDDEVRRILQVMGCIQVSIGGLDAATYKKMYGVDRFPRVQKGIERLLALRKEVADPPYINFAFRTNDWKFELRFRRQLAGYRRQGVFVSHIWHYANYAGLVHDDDRLQLKVIEDPGMEKRIPCIFAVVHMAIGWDGRITACGCTDFEGTALRIGQAGEDSLGEVWSGKKRQRILDSFAAGKLPQICRQCSAYLPDKTIFSSTICRGIQPHGPLPATYFQHFWGG